MDFLPTSLSSTCDQAHPIYSWCNHACSEKWKHWAYLPWAAPSLLEVTSPWATGAYTFEAFLLHRSLKHNNLDFKHIINHYSTTTVSFHCAPNTSKDWLGPSVAGQQWKWTNTENIRGWCICQSHVTSSLLSCPVAQTVKKIHATPLNSLILVVAKQHIDICKST